MSAPQAIRKEIDQIPARPRPGGGGHRMSVKRVDVNLCIGCGMCMRKCPQEAIKVVDNLAVVDDALCVGCGICREVCPRKCIL